jgi:hypothetical protein
MPKQASRPTPSPIPRLPGGDGPAKPSFDGSWRWFWPFVAICLVLQAVLAVDCARQWTPTHDEYWHLPIGLRMWKSGRFDDDVINPPPVRLWAAIPLVLGGAKPGDIDSKLDVGDIGDAFWKANGDQARGWFFWGRLMIVPLATLTGLAVVVWSRSWYGERAALISVLLWTCCPTALANSAIVTHDLALAAFWTMTLLALARFAEQPTWRRAILFGVLLGLTPLTKLTGLILVPLSVVLWFVLSLGAGKQRNSPEAKLIGVDPATLQLPASGRSRTTFLQWVVALSVSLAVINACYLFRGTGTPLGGLKLASSRLQAVQQINPLTSLPVLLPTDFVAALDRLSQDLERHHPVYLDGEWSDRPFARYYAAAMCYKLPISTLILVLVSLASVVRPRPNSQDWRHGVFLLIAASILPVLASGSSNQIGIRYVLPTIPLLCVFAGQSARWLNYDSVSLRSVWMKRVVWAMLVAAPLSLRFHPHHLAYFNVIAGGPLNGRWHLVDSNLDWGQDLYALKAFLDQQHVDDVGLAYFGTVSSDSIGIKSHVPPSRFPQAGWYAISANFVQGRPHAIRGDDGKRLNVGLEEFGYFRFFEPVTTIGYSIYVYRLSQQDVARYAAALQQLQRESGT